MEEEIEEIEEIEEWKNCGESKLCIYYVSNLGQVKSVTKKGKERILKPFKITKGYLAVDINKKTEKVHRLVAYAFLGERPEGLQIDHQDRDKTNNSADNLRYVTGSENMVNRDCYRTDFSTDKKIRNCQSTKECYAKNKQIIIKCGCGSITSKAQLRQHETSQTHKAYL